MQSKTASQRREASDRIKELMAERQNLLVNQTIERLKIRWGDNETVKTLVDSAMDYWGKQKKCRELQRREEDPSYQINPINLPTWNSDVNFLERITLNYICHKCSNYDKLLNCLEGQVGQEVAYESLKKEVAERVEARFDSSLYSGIKRLKAIYANS